MLPQAPCSFKIPNLNDDLELSCRLYFPRSSVSSNGIFVSGFAIFAHPYAPLGGCYDDPMVQTIGEILLRQGFVLCTFNFRGAAGSPGSTSWTGKAELSDYVSVYTFMLYFINMPGVMNHVISERGSPVLILGGYSYICLVQQGSMIASHLPDLETTLSISDPTREGSTDHEIELRAQEIAKAFLGYSGIHILRGRQSLHAENIPSAPSSGRGLVLGGYESELAGQRVRRSSSKKSVDVERVRHSIDRIRHRMSPRRNPADSGQRDDDNKVPPESDPVERVLPQVARLLVSPLLGPVSGLTTIFTKLVFERKSSSRKENMPPPNSQDLIQNPTFAIYGGKDVFTSSRKLGKWAQELQSTPGSRFSFREIANAGHFWHEEGVREELQLAVVTWIQSLRAQNPHNTQIAKAT